MRDIIEGPPDEGEPRPPVWRRLAWFAGLALAGLAATAAVAYAPRAMLGLN
ncbi:MAG TPA: hypothetical protein PKB04_12285 [Phenylobacterium sp.]|nr:hypothetical protein [Phenylobacterium sp.]